MVAVTCNYLYQLYCLICPSIFIHHGLSYLHMMASTTILVPLLILSTTQDIHYSYYYYHHHGYLVIVLVVLLMCVMDPIPSTIQYHP